MVSGGLGTSPGTGFRGPERLGRGRGSISAQFWPGRNGINFSDLFRAVFADFSVFAFRATFIVDYLRAT